MALPRRRGGQCGYLIDENNVIQAKKLGENSLENIIKAICGGEE